MSTLRGMTQLLPASILVLAMLFITLDIAASLEPSTNSPSADVGVSAKPPVADAASDQKPEAAISTTAPSDNTIVKLAD
jgi:hypothetical protein